jgi:hypothetical protein
MQSKYYTIPSLDHLAAVQAWAENPDNRCQVITQGRVGEVTHSLCVNQPENYADVITPTETALAGMIVETAWPE